MEKTSSLFRDNPLTGFSATANPFSDDNISPFTSRRFTPRLTCPTISILAVFIFFHILLCVLSLIILIMSWAGKSQRPHKWLLRKRYIYGYPGQKGGFSYSIRTMLVLNGQTDILSFVAEKVYSTPLYFVNAGVLMSASQLMSSITTQAYIWMRIRMHLSEDYALQCQFFPALGLMFIFNIYSYWSMTHCFLTLSYRNEIPLPKSKALGWMRSPLLINTFFVIFPIAATVGAIVVVTRLCVVYHDLQVQTRSLRATLHQGSLLWNQQQTNSISQDDKANLSSQLIQTQNQLESSLRQTDTILPKLLDRFNSVRSMILFFIPATGLVFVVSFWRLADKFKRQGRGSNSSATPSYAPTYWEGHQENPEQFCVPSESTRAFFETLRSDQQFLRLTLRAVATLLAILSGMLLGLLTIFKSNDIIFDPFWHGIATWLPTISGSWTALPVAWHFVLAALPREKT
ncbi:hypothetical protein VP01_2164g1 [Puccinia sorghi]|uniref:Uncharacterized protein n=1 Tax=Puccinia sorghi TaxID=27349 RepID=A0A0L6V9G2_9BASI|nr:hypothetical protein VP01_2164g1 [Puccinia sorghi]